MLIWGLCYNYWVKVCKKCGLEKTGSHASYCKSCNSARVVAWKEANREKYNDYMRKFYKNKNAERSTRKPLTEEQRASARISQAKWRSKNLHKYREYDRKRRALRLKNGFEKYSEDQVLSRYGNECHICNHIIDLNASRSVGVAGWELSLHIDHLIPISKGGQDRLENVRPSHAACNLKKSNLLY
jgi:5-methylcytosine-specific restriction endonuclease McrA